jgi:hypothetical protein
MAGAAQAAEAPAWMRSQLATPLPAHDDKTEAAVLFNESVVTVQPNGKIKRVDRKVIKILRPDGESRGVLRFYWGPQDPISDLHGWCIPTSGKDFEVKMRDAADVAVDVEGSELVGDLHVKTLAIPAAKVGAVIGFEVERELRPYFALDSWQFQDDVPVREARYTLQLAPNWHYQANWVNHAAVEPVVSGNQYSFTVSDIAAVKIESHMPPWKGIAARLEVALLSNGASGEGIQTWNELAAWQAKLVQGRRDATPAIKQKTAELTSQLDTPLAKMRALASFVQSQIRYVAIELGIGGYQPHPAGDVFAHRYGDCKDKVTLLSAMLHEIGIESYYVIINTERGAVSATTPPNLEFDHAIMAIALPKDVDTSTLAARIQHPTLGGLLFFDPTDEMIPLGLLSGDLQANYGMLVTSAGGELLRLPQLEAASNGVVRTAKLAIDEKGALLGQVHEVRVGDSAAVQRYALRMASANTDQIKSVERVAAKSLSNFQIPSATMRNSRTMHLPLEWDYTLQVDKYAKTAGDLLLVRPHVLGSHAQSFLETHETRVNAIEFEAPQHDSDAVEIAVPAGYSLDELPAPVDLETAFGSYHSKSEFKNGVLRHSSSFEIKQLSLPAAQAEQLRDFYRTIYGDERAAAVFKHE